MVTLQIPAEMTSEQFGVSQDVFEKEVRGNHLPIVEASGDLVFVLVGQNPEPHPIHVATLVNNDSHTTHSTRF